MQQIVINENLLAQMEAFREGDLKAFSYFYDLFYTRLCVFAVQIIDDQAAAEDIVAEVFVKLWQKRTHFQTAENIKGFLYISTKNACRNYLKHQLHVRNYENEVSRLPVFDDDWILNEIIVTEVYHALNNAIAGLPEQCAKVLKMSYLDQMKNQEIADTLQISIHTVKSQKARAISLLRKELGNKLLMTSLLVWPYLELMMHKD
jgi:RNA polymerase sigma-70 factor (family 1)